MISALVVITIDTIRNALLVANNSMSPAQMSNKLIEQSIVTFSVISSMKLGAKIGQMIAP